MSVQSFLLILGVVLLVAAAACGGAAVYTYRALNIKAVRDDLSGRTRAGAIEALSRGERHRVVQRSAAMMASTEGANPKNEAVPAAFAPSRPVQTPIIIPMQDVQPVPAEESVPGAAQGLGKSIVFVVIKREIVPDRADVLEDGA